MNCASAKSMTGIVGQLLFIGLITAGLMVFSNSPPYVHFPSDQALLKVSITHAGQIRGECRKRSAEELARLSPNMRVAEDCPRERSPIELELLLDGKPLYHDILSPSGIKRDGTASVYHRLPLPIGRHRLLARMKDHEKLAEFNYVREMDVNLAPAQVFVVDFAPEAGGFVFR